MRKIFLFFLLALTTSSSVYCSDDLPLDKSRTKQSIMKAKKNAQKLTISKEDLEKIIQKAQPKKNQAVAKIDQKTDVFYYRKK